MFNIIRRCRQFCLALGLLSILPGSAFAVTELTVSSWLPPGYFFVTDALRPWAEAVEKETEGRVKVTILPAPLGRPQAAFDVVREGQADVSYGVHGYQPGRFELTKIVELPFTGNSGEAISAAYWHIYKKYLEAANEHRGVQVLSVYTHSPGHIFHLSRPMLSLDDLKGQKMRVGGGIMNETAQKLGMSPLLHPASELYQILSNKIADGALLTLDALEGFKISNLIKHITEVPGGLYNSSFFFVMNRDKFSQLSPEDQEIIMRLSGENFARMAGRSYDQVANKATDVIKEHHISLHAAPESLLADIRDRTAPMESAWIANAGKKGVDGRKAIDELRALAAEFEETQP